MTRSTAVDLENPAVTRRAWGVLAVATGALFLEGIDIAMLNVAVPSIAGGLGLGTGSAHWVISAYVLGYAGFMVLGGRTADLLGRRRVFLVAMTVFIVFSALGGFAQDGWVLVLVRFITGATAGFMTPAGFSVLTTSFPEGPQRNRALAIYGAIGASGFLMGVVVGGLLTTLGWRWVFFAPALLGLMFLGLGWMFIPRDAAVVAPDDEPPMGRRRFDLAGGTTLTAAMVATVYGIVTVGHDPGDRAGLVAFATGAALLVAFIAIERRTADPLIPPGVLTKGLLPWASMVGLLFIGAFFAWQFLLTLYMQEYLGWSALHTGLAFAAMGVELVIAPFLTPRLVDLFGNVVVMVAGLVSAAISFALTLNLDESSGFIDLLPSLLLLGVAFALTYGPLTAGAVEGVDESEHGVAGGIVYTAFQFGAALGVSTATIGLLAGDSSPVLDDYQRALIIPAVAAGIAVLLGLLTVWRHRAITIRGGSER